MERDQHPTPERGAGKGAGDHAPDPAHGQEAPRSIPAPPAVEAEPSGAVEPAAPEPAAPPGPESGPGADAIMSRLPRTRPQRVTGRRQREPAVSRKPSSSPAPRSSPGRPKSRAGTAARAAKQAKQRPAVRSATPRPARRSSPAAAPARRSRVHEPPAPSAHTGGAPGLPRLAMDGAVEAAKLPLKVGGRLTLRALDAVARGLRGG